VIRLVGTIETALRNPRPYSRGWNFSPAGNGTGNGGGRSTGVFTNFGDPEGHPDRPVACAQRAFHATKGPGQP
jgi:hypothetical protein